MSRTYSNGGKTGSQLPVRAFTPSDFLEGRGGQIHRQLLHGDGWMVRGPLQEPWRSSSLSSGLGWQRLFAWLPNRHRALHAHHILQFQLGESVAKLGVDAVSRVSQHNATVQVSRARRT